MATSGGVGEPSASSNSPQPKKRPVDGGQLLDGPQGFVPPDEGVQRVLRDDHAFDTIHGEGNSVGRGLQLVCSRLEC